MEGLTRRQTVRRESIHDIEEGATEKDFSGSDDDDDSKMPSRMGSLVTNCLKKNRCLDAPRSEQILRCHRGCSRCISAASSRITSSCPTGLKSVYSFYQLWQTRIVPQPSSTATGASITQTARTPSAARALPIRSEETLSQTTTKATPSSPLYIIEISSTPATSEATVDEETVTSKTCDLPVVDSSVQASQVPKLLDYTHTRAPLPKMPPIYIQFSDKKEGNLLGREMASVSDSTLAALPPSRRRKRRGTKANSGESPRVQFLLHIPESQRRPKQRNTNGIASDHPKASNIVERLASSVSSSGRTDGTASSGRGNATERSQQRRHPRSISVGEASNQSGPYPGSAYNDKKNLSPSCSYRGRTMGPKSNRLESISPPRSSLRMTMSKEIVIPLKGSNCGDDAGATPIDYGYNVWPDQQDGPSEKIGKTVDPVTVDYGYNVWPEDTKQFSDSFRSRSGANSDDGSTGWGVPPKRRVRVHRRSSFVAGSKIEHFDGSRNNRIAPARSKSSEDWAPRNKKDRRDKRKGATKIGEDLSTMAQDRYNVGYPSQEHLASSRNDRLDPASSSRNLQPKSMRVQRRGSLLAGSKIERYDGSKNRPLAY